MVQVFIGAGYVNNRQIRDVVFKIEGQPFYAHKLALSASSEAFTAMFQSDCREGKGGIPTIEIPNIKWEVFNAMVRSLSALSASRHKTLSQSRPKVEHEPSNDQTY